MTKSEKVLWVFLCCLIFPIVFLILRLHNLKEKTNQQDIESLDKLKYLNQLENDLKDSKAKIEKLENEKNNLQSQITNLYERNRKSLIENVDDKFFKLNSNLKEFASLFQKGTKQTGSLAEGLLERMFSNIQSIGNKNSYLTITRQHTIENNGKKLIPDLTINSQNDQFPPVYIDAKYPKLSFENYYKDTSNKENKKLFIDSLKKHINDISKRYVEGTKASFAIMFLPSEILFTEATLLDQGFGKSQYQQSIPQDRSFISYAFDKRVVPCSPTNIISVLMTLEKYFDLFDEVQNNEQRIRDINVWMTKNKLFFTNVCKIIEQYNNLGLTIQKLLKNLQELTAKYTTLPTFETDKEVKMIENPTTS